MDITVLQTIKQIYFVIKIFFVNEIKIKIGNTITQLYIEHQIYTKCNLNEIKEKVFKRKRICLGSAISNILCFCGLHCFKIYHTFKM